MITEIDSNCTRLWAFAQEAGSAPGPGHGPMFGADFGLGCDSMYSCGSLFFF